MDVGTDGLDHARRVTPWRVRQWRFDRVVAGSHVGVEGIDADGVQLQEHLARAWLRIGHVLELKNFGTTKLTDENRMHDGADRT